jgi:hypothetical protein
MAVSLLDVLVSGTPDDVVGRPHRGSAGTRASDPTGMRRATVAAPAAAHAVAYATPAITSWDRLRLALWPALAGLGRPDGVALAFDDGPDPRGTFADVGAP